jgi:hypothetical protein
MMEWFNILRARLRALFRRESVLRDIEEELRIHVEMETETNIKRGMAPDEARAAALKSFGNPVQNTERGYDIRGGGWLETLWQDLRSGLRMMLKNPNFTTIAVLTLALGIGANTAIFSVVNAVLLKSLPYPEAEQLVRVYDVFPAKNQERTGPSVAEWLDLRQARSFDAVGVYDTGNLNLSADGGHAPERLESVAVTPEILSLLKVAPYKGRLFLPADTLPGNDQVVILSHSLWQRRFGADDSLVGKNILLNGRNFQVVGIMAPGFAFPQ